MDSLHWSTPLVQSSHFRDCLGEVFRCSGWSDMVLRGSPQKTCKQASSTNQTKLSCPSEADLLHVHARSSLPHKAGVVPSSSNRFPASEATTFRRGRRYCWRTLERASPMFLALNVFSLTERPFADVSHSSLPQSSPPKKIALRSMPSSSQPGYPTASKTRDEQRLVLLRLGKSRRVVGEEQHVDSSASSDLPADRHKDERRYT